MTDDENSARSETRQYKKSAAMRRLICEATLSALAELGYERTTMDVISKRAGVSKGAITHQFGSRDAVLTAAFRHLIALWHDERREHAEAQTGRGRMTADEFCDYLWGAFFSRPDYIASLELMLAARMNPDLKQSLSVVSREWQPIRDRLSCGLLGLDPDDPRALSFLHVNLAFLRGLAVHAPYDSPDQLSRLLSYWKEMVAAPLRDLRRADGAGTQDAPAP